MNIIIVIDIFCITIIYRNILTAVVKAKTATGYEKRPDTNAIRADRQTEPVEGGNTMIKEKADMEISHSGKDKKAEGKRAGPEKNKRAAEGRWDLPGSHPKKVALFVSFIMVSAALFGMIGTDHDENIFDGTDTSSGSSQPMIILNDLNNGVSGTGWSFTGTPSGGTLTFNKNSEGHMYVLQSSPVCEISIVFEANVITAVVLNDMNITGDILLDDAADITLLLNGSNSIKGSIFVETNRSLTIDSASSQGTGNVNGSLTIIASKGAGIGGRETNENNGGDAGDITINGGTVTVLGGHGSAGIGGGGGVRGDAIENDLSVRNGGDGGSGGVITINGGTVTVTGRDGGAGMGGGAGGRGGNGGNGGQGGVITINGGTVKATGGEGGAGMGGGAGGLGDDGGRGGDGGGGGKIAIAGGDVTATGGNARGLSAQTGGGGAGMGGGGGGTGDTDGCSHTTPNICTGSAGNGGAGGNMTLTGGTLKATGGTAFTVNGKNNGGAAGIGGGGGGSSDDKSCGTAGTGGDGGMIMFTDPFAIVNNPNTGSGKGGYDRWGGSPDGNAPVISDSLNVIFDLNGGTGIIPNMQSAQFKSVISAEQKPIGIWIREGYITDGEWYTLSKGMYTLFEFGTTIVRNHLTLYLKWTEATVTIDAISLETCGNEYSGTISATTENDAGGTIVYGISGNIPEGLTLTASTGAINVKPISSGAFEFTVHATNTASGAYDEKTLTIELNDITGTVVPQYSVTLTPGQGYTLMPLSQSPVTDGGEFTFGFTLDPMYSGSPFTVYVNDSPVEMTDGGEYTISDITGPVTVTVSGIEPNGYYTWSNDPSGQHISMEGALNAWMPGSGNLMVTGSLTDDLKNGVLVFDKSVTLCLTEGAELTLKDGTVTMGGVTNDGKLVLDNTTLIILGNLTGSGSIESVNESNLIAEGDVNIDGDLSAGGNACIGGNLDVGGNADIGGDLNAGGDVNITGDLDVGGNADIGGDLNAGGDLKIEGDLKTKEWSVSVEGIEKTYQYTGSEIRPEVIVTCNDKILTEGTDYVITYSNNINVGKAEVTLEFINDCKDVLAITKSFTIVGEGAGVSYAMSAVFPGFLCLLLLAIGIMYTEMR